MDEETGFVLYEGVVVPESALRCAEQRNLHGSVPGLDDDELADFAELERQVYREAFEPVLALPVRGTKQGIRPDFDEGGGVDWGAFGTVDFERTVPGFDKARYKAHKLREELRDVLILLSIVRERLPRAAYRVLKYLRMGLIALEHIDNEDALAFVKLNLRAERLRKGMREFREADTRRRHEEVVWAGV